MVKVASFLSHCILSNALLQLALKRLWTFMVGYLSSSQPNHDKMTLSLTKSSTRRSNLFPQEIGGLFGQRWLWLLIWLKIFSGNVIGVFSCCNAHFVTVFLFSNRLVPIPNILVTDKVHCWILKWNLPEYIKT